MFGSAHAHYARVDKCIYIRDSVTGACELVAPISVALDVAPRHLEQAVGAVVCDNLLSYTPGTSDLVAVLAVEQVLEGI